MTLLLFIISMIIAVVEQESHAAIVRLLAAAATSVCVCVHVQCTYSDAKLNLFSTKKSLISVAWHIINFPCFSARALHFFFRVDGVSSKHKLTSKLHFQHRFRQKKGFSCTA